MTRDKFIKVRVTEEELDMFRRVSKNEGKTMSAFIRTILDVLCLRDALGVPISSRANNIFPDIVRDYDYKPGP
jgi:antitoxin component of RelBE/YafQ-DinJ toxin-antitoxin module